MANELSPEHRQRITEATEVLQAAQREVDRALKALGDDTPRAQKQMVGAVLRDALDKLSAAQAKLEQVIAG